MSVEYRLDRFENTEGGMDWDSFKENGETVIFDDIEAAAAVLERLEENEKLHTRNNNWEWLIVVDNY
jgi:hypothetical protein